MSEASVLLCTAGYDHTVRFWEASTATPARHVSFNNSQVNCLVISNDKRFIAVAGHQIVKVFEVASDDQVSLHLTLSEHTSNVTAVGFQKDNKWMFTASEDGTARIWDISHRKSQAGKCQRIHKVTKDGVAINSAVLHPNQGEIFLGDQHGYIRVWDLTANKCSVWHQPEGTCPMRSLTIASDATYLCAANDHGTVYVYSREDDDSVGIGPNKKWQACKKIHAHNTYILKVLLSPDCNYLATASADMTIKLFDVEDDFKHYKTLSGHQRWVWDIAFSADSAYLVSASSDRTAKLWDIAKGKDILNYKRHTKALTSVALNDSQT